MAKARNVEISQTGLKRLLTPGRSSNAHSMTVHFLRDIRGSVLCSCVWEFHVDQPSVFWRADIYMTALGHKTNAGEPEDAPTWLLLSSGKWSRSRQKNRGSRGRLERGNSACKRRSTYMRLVSRLLMLNLSSVHFVGASCSRHLSRVDVPMGC